MLIEPSAGSGTFVKLMREAWPTSPIMAIDLRNNAQNLMNLGATYAATYDWCAWVRYMAQAAQFTTPVVLIGNPPFSLAQVHLEEAFRCLPVGSEINFLLRNGFFGGRARNETFWKKAGGQFLDSFTPIAPRPSFVKGKNDNSEYAIFTWAVGKDFTPAKVKPPLIWEKRVRPLK